MMDEMQTAILITAVNLENHNLLSYIRYLRRMKGYEKVKMRDDSINNYQILKSANSEEVDRIYSEFGKRARRAFMYNTFGWTIFAIPLIIVGQLLKVLFPKIKKKRPISYENLEEYRHYEQQMNPVNFKNKSAEKKKMAMAYSGCQ